MGGTSGESSIADLLKDNFSGIANPLAPLITEIRSWMHWGLSQAIIMLLMYMNWCELWEDWKIRRLLVTMEFHLKIISLHLSDCWPWCQYFFPVVQKQKCFVGFTIRWLIQLHDLISNKATTYLVVVTNSDSCNDLGNTTIWWVTLPIMGSYSYYKNLVKCTSVVFRVWVQLQGLLFAFYGNWPYYFAFIWHCYDRYIYLYAN